MLPWVFGAWKPLELAFVLTGCSGLAAACLVHRIQVTTSVTPFFLAANLCLWKNWKASVHFSVALKNK